MLTDEIVHLADTEPVPVPVGELTMRREMSMVPAPACSLLTSSIAVPLSGCSAPLPGEDHAGCSTGELDRTRAIGRQRSARRRKHPERLPRAR